MSTNKQIILKKNPVGIPEITDFDTIETDIPEITNNQILTKTVHLSLDPYIRGVITGRHIYSEKVNVGDTIVGRTVSEVVKSNHTNFSEGDIVVCSNGWQEFGVSDGEGVRKLDPSLAPLSPALGILGMPGLTAYAGLTVYGEPKDGDHVVVSAASGPVGCMVGQIAQIYGAKAIGIAGSEEKCSVVKNKFGFIDCINYKTEKIEERLKDLCPDGVDIYFDNVGGETLENNDKKSSYACTYSFVRIHDPIQLRFSPPGPNLGPIVGSRATIRGVVVYDHYDKQDDFISIASDWLKAGKIDYIEDEVFGLENAPAQFCKLMRGENFGKTIVTIQ
ncbi:MAG: NADP-dependent oxidoreductase [Gammaproteobacteria bacterium]|nr:MAG: NADP-dependent oxidoreductase [Gammaproteobacteria bacterium]